MGQYSQIWNNHRIRLFFAASRSVSVTSLLKVDVWPIESSSSRSPDRAACERWSSSWIRLRIVPRRSQAEPSCGGSMEAISRRIREESLHPRPLVVTPIWRGPSVCVERRLNVQSAGASATLTGIRCRLQSWEICAPLFVSSHKEELGGYYLLNGSRGPEVTKTASTTLSISSLPSCKRSPSSNGFANHSTSPLSIRFCSA